MIKQAVQIMVLFLLFTSVVFAQATTVDPGMTPDRFWWKLDVLFDDISELLTLNKQAKMEAQLAHAEERLAELKAMAELKKFDAMKSAEEAHARTLVRLSERVRTTQEQDPTDELASELTIEKKIRDHRKKVQHVEDDVRVTIKTKGALAPEQQAVLDSVLSSLKDHVGRVEIEIKTEKGKTKIKIEKETGKKGDEVELELEEKLGLTEERKQDVKEELAEAEKELNELLEEARTEHVDVNQGMRTAFNAHLKKAQEELEKGNVAQAESFAEKLFEELEKLEEKIENAEEKEDEKEAEKKIKKDEAPKKQVNDNIAKKEEKDAEKEDDEDQSDMDDESD